MSDFTDDYKSFFFQSSSNIVRLECLEIIHPQFTQVYRVVRNAVNGVVVKHEDGGSYEYEYYPLRIASMGVTSDLDSGIRVDLGDLGEILPKELRAIMKGTGINIKPIVKYRTYRSDILTYPMDGPLILEIKNLSYNSEGCSFQAKAPSLNVSTTGEIYDLTRFYPLRGFLY